MIKDNFRKTFFLLKRYNFSEVNEKNFFELLPTFAEKEQLIYDCYLFEMERFNFFQKIENEGQIRKNNKISYFLYQKMSKSSYKQKRDLSLIFSDSAYVKNTSYDFTIIDKLTLSDDLNGMIWKEFLESHKSKVSIVSKYLPEIEDFIDFKLSTLQKIIFSLYEDGCSMKEVISALVNHSMVTEKFSNNSIRNFVYVNTKFFLYWGILIKYKNYE